MPSAPLAGFRGISVRLFSQTLFNRYGVAVEIISMQLLFALVGALYLGRRR
jgi:NADH-quinone oxidoreductase subunit J